MKLILDPSADSPTTLEYNDPNGEGVLLKTGDYRIVLNGKMKALNFDLEKISIQEQIHTFAIVAKNQTTRATARISGLIIHSLERQEALPIAHTIVKGVDLWDGHLTVTSQDIVIPGRGLSLDFTRTYSSAGSSSNSSLGAGWSHSYQIQLNQDGGNWTIVGGEGSGNTFTEATSSYQDEQRQLFQMPNAKFYQPQAGYHTTLVQPDPSKPEFDFYTKAHVRYHFVRDNHACFILQYIRDPNGNEIDLFYDSRDTRATERRKNCETHSTVIQQRSTTSRLLGRALLFHYDTIFGSNRITSITGYDPDRTDLKGLKIEYKYDENQTSKVGNLTSVTRVETTDSSAPKSRRTEKYKYYEAENSDNHNLHKYIDPSGQVTTYTFGEGLEPTVRLRDAIQRPCRSSS